MKWNGGRSAADERQNRRRLGLVQGWMISIVLMVGWFSCVLGAAWRLSWLGPAVVAIFLLLYLQYSRGWRRDLVLMATLAVVGTGLDTLQMHLGLITFEGARSPSWLAPPWITALWLQFGTLRHGLLRALYGRWPAAALCGAITGPVAYAAGVVLGAGHFTPPAWRSLLWLALVWALLLPAASWLAWRGTTFGRHREQKVAARGRGEP